MIGVVGITTLIIGFIQNSQIKQIKCEDQASLNTLSNMGTGVTIMGVLLILSSVVYYYFTRDKIIDEKIE
jgi:hypothetical protein